MLVLPYDLANLLGIASFRRQLQIGFQLGYAALALTALQINCPEKAMRVLNLVTTKRDRACEMFFRFAKTTKIGSGDFLK